MEQHLFERITLETAFNVCSTTSSVSLAAARAVVAPAEGVVPLKNVFWKLHVHFLDFDI